MKGINLEIWKRFFLGQSKMKFDYIFWDIDGTMRPSSSENFVFPEIKEIISSCVKERQGIITNGHHSRQLSFLENVGVSNLVNMDLFFSPTVFVEEALSSESHELKDISKSFEFEDLRTEASKHKDYIFRRVLERIGDSSCIIVDDSLGSVLSAKRNGFKTVYLIRDKSEFDLIDRMNFEIDYIVGVDELNKLKEILIN